MNNTFYLSAILFFCAQLAQAQLKNQNNTQAVSDYNLTATIVSKSVNAFTVLSDPRTMLYAHPDLNAVALFRRGGPNDPGGATGNKGNKIYYDLSTNGGSLWQAAKGKLHDDDDYQSLMQPPNATYGGRVPIGLIWNPPGNTIVNNAFVAGFSPVLSNPQYWWGALAYTSSKVGSPAAVHKNLIDDTTFSRMAGYSVAVNAAGHIIHVEKEIKSKFAENGDIINYYPGNLIITKFIINPENGAMTHEAKKIALPGNPEKLPYNILNPKINFAPDGTIGYISFLAYLGDSVLQRRKLYYPFVLKSTDGGENWSSPYTISLSDDPNFINMRNAMMGDSFSAYDEQRPNIVYKEKVLYSPLIEHDATVDIHGDLHFLSTIIALLDDSGKILPALITNIDHIRTVDLQFRNSSNTFQYSVIGISTTISGKLPGWTSAYNHSLRPQLSRNKAGTKIFYTYFATDTSKYPTLSLPSYSNHHPDLYLAGMDVSNANNYRFMRTRNVTHGSQLDGKMYYPSLSPFVLEQNEKVHIPLTFIRAEGDVTDPIEHIYLGGVEVDLTSDTVFVHDPIVYDDFPTQTQAAIFSKLLINIYPNPAVQTLHIKGLPASQFRGQYIVHNLLGQVLMSGSIDAESDAELNVSALKKGIYTITIQQRDFMSTAKFLKE